MKRLITLWGLLLVLAGCTSTSSSTSYYLLTADSPRAVDEPSAGADSVGVGPIAIPEYLRRSQIAWFTADNILRLADGERWSEPLEGAIPRVIATNLARLNAGRPVTVFPWRLDEEPAYALRVDVVHLNRENGQAVLEANWRLIDNESKQLLQRGRFTGSRQLAPFSFAALASAYSELLAQLSARLDQALNQAASS